MIRIAEFHRCLITKFVAVSLSAIERDNLVDTVADYNVQSIVSITARMGRVIPHKTEFYESPAHDWTQYTSSIILLKVTRHE